MPYDVTFTQDTLCKGEIRASGSTLNVDDETARMLVDLGVATASGLSPQAGSSAALFADTFLAKSDNLSSVASTPASRTNLSVPSTSDVTSQIAASVANFPRKSGTWSNSTTYNVGDFVTYQNATFVCTQQHSNRVPLAETAYWQTVSMGWNWMVIPYKNLSFGNQRLSGTGVDATNTTNISYVRAGLAATSTSNNAIAIYRVLAVGVPSYWHRYYDGENASQQNNTINMGRAGAFRAAFSPTYPASALAAGGIMYLDVGRTYSEVGGSGTISTLTGPLDKRGFGIRMVTNSTGTAPSSAFVSYHDGTSLTETSFDPSLIRTLGGINKLEVTWDGRGNMIWFLNGVEIHRVTSAQTDVWGMPTWCSIAMGIYNAPNTSGVAAMQMLWLVNEETGFVTG
jgi:hypothetical protein